MDRWSAIRNALQCIESDGQIERLLRMKTTLEKVQKSLDQYLEKKRQVRCLSYKKTRKQLTLSQIFPRFYFLSDDDLLEILGQTRDPSQVQKHIKKCFAGIHRLEMQSKDRDTNNGQIVKNWEVIGMISEVNVCFMNSSILLISYQDGEKVRFLYGIAAQGPVELWLIKVEKSMRETLRKQMQDAVAAVLKSISKRENWIRSTIGQLLITSGQVWLIQLITVG